MAIQAILGDPVSGQDVTAFLEWDTWNVDGTFGQRGATGTFYLFEDISANPTNWSLLPLELQQFTLTDTSIGEVIFAGVVIDPKLYKEGPTENRWELNCKDYSLYSDNRFVAGDFYNKTGDFIIKQLVALAPGCGITTNNVPAMPQIPRCVVNWKSLTDAISYVCQLCSQGALWGWSIDSNRDLHTFNALAQTPLASPLFTDNQALVDEVATFAYVWDGFYYEWDGASVRNRIRVRGGNYTGSQHDTFVGNGQQSNFALSYPLNTTNPANSVSVGGTQLTSSIDTTGGPVPAGQCFLTQQPNGGWMARFGTVPANAAVIHVNYNYLSPVITQVDDAASEAAYNVQQTGFQDGNFESQATSPWQDNSVGTGASNLADTSNPHSGTYDATLTNPSSGNYGGMFNTQGIPIAAGQALTLSAWLAGSAPGSTGPLRLVFANPGANISASGVASAQPSAQPGAVSHDLNPSVTASYAQYSHTVTVPSGYAFAFVEVYANNNGTVATLYVDDVTITVPAPNGGIYEMYLSDPTIADLLTAKVRGQREISEYGVAEEKVYFQTKDSTGFHVDPGDVVTWSCSMVPDLTRPGNPIGISGGHYVIAQLHIAGTKGGFRTYTITGARVS